VQFIPKQIAGKMEVYQTQGINSEHAFGAAVLRLSMEFAGLGNAADAVAGKENATLSETLKLIGSRDLSAFERGRSWGQFQLVDAPLALAALAVPGEEFASTPSALLAREAPAEFRIIAGLTSEPEGVVYLRMDTQGKVKPYVGKAQSPARFVARTGEHEHTFRAKGRFEFWVIGRAEPGPALDALEEDFIRASGGPAQLPGSRLSNRRFQVGRDIDDRLP
jgi:hypothetical protein